VQSAKVRQDGGRHSAEVVMKRGHGLSMSEIDKALEVANREMGDPMGTTYKLAGSLDLSSAHFFKTQAAPNEAKLKESLGKLKGFDSVSTSKAGFGVVFKGDKTPTLAEVKKASGAEVTDVVLAGAKDGARYSCAMHPEKASAVAGKCPVCEMDMTKVAATQVTASTGAAKPADAACSSCGAKSAEAGCARGCGSCKAKCGKCCGAGCGAKKDS
jgi:hypothetical protein